MRDSVNNISSASDFVIFLLEASDSKGINVEFVFWNEPHNGKFLLITNLGFENSYICYSSL
jgi:hypothetical protein